MFFPPFAQLFSPLPLILLDIIFLFVRFIHLPFLQHPANTKELKNIIINQADPEYCFNINVLYHTSHLWSGRRRLSVGGSRGFMSGVSSFSSMAKVEKP